MQTPVQRLFFCQIWSVFMCKLSLIITTIIIIMLRVHRNRWPPYTIN